ncbi:hypothetical protein KSP40_PGU008660 [Platanthera guangdongensis]|uniref:Uncharacterized protein n=1 Tax=Platanthera guangdongensis TaxID=2320717 RepID=A0ABR2LI32_9ASPA
MDAILLKYNASFALWTIEFNPSDANSFSLCIQPPPDLQNPSPNGRNRSPETAKPSPKHLVRSLRKNIGRLLFSCWKDSDTAEPEKSRDRRSCSPGKFGFQSRFSVADRDEKVRRAIEYCKSTMTANS